MNNDQLYFYNKGFNDCLAKFLDTHPVKELTDEEIAFTWNEFSALQNPKDIKDFARAILRKAQEK